MAASKSKPAAPKRTPIKDKMTKTQMLAEISENTQLTKKQVSAVFDELIVLINRHIRKGGAGEFTLPGLLKIKTKIRPARKADPNWINPFTKQQEVRKAKPASVVVRALPLKALKEMVK